MREFLLSLPPEALNYFMIGFFVLAILVAGMLFLRGRGSRSIVDRMERAADGKRRAAEPGQKGGAVSLRKRDSSIKAVDAAIRDYLPNPEKLRMRLVRTGTGMQLGTYLMLCVAAFALGVAFGTMVLGQSLARSLLIGFGVGMAVPHLVVGFLIGRRKKKFLSSLPDALDVLVRGLKAGLPGVESMRIVASEMTGPVAEEFTRITDGLKIGGEFDDVLWQAAKRIDMREFEFFVITLSISRETGGNLGETLENLSDMLRKRKMVKGKVRALSSEAKASAIIIGSLPFVLFGILYLLNRDYVMTLFTHPTGPVLLGIGLGSLGFGIGVMAKMTRFEI
jgi:tight adherence protein B